MSRYEMLFRKVQTIFQSILRIFNSTVFARQSIAQKPESYEEAYNLSYGLVMQNQEEALKVIKYIDRKNLPVKESDVFFVNSIASLAMRPIYRENEIGKRLFQKVVTTKKNDFNSNRILMAFAEMGNNFEETKKHACNLLDTDYNSYIKCMEPADNSRLPTIRNYMDNLIDTYQNIANFFLKNGDKVNGKKAIDIVENIKMKRK